MFRRDGGPPEKDFLSVFCENELEVVFSSPIGFVVDFVDV